MTARQTDLARAMGQAMQRAATGRSLLTSAFTRPEQIGAIELAPGLAVPVMSPTGDLYFLADYDEADGPSIAG